MKKKIDCPEYEILLKETDSESVSVLVNGEKFIEIQETTLDEIDEDKLISWISVEYERWAFGDVHVFDKYKFMKDGSTCVDSKS